MKIGDTVLSLPPLWLDLCALGRNSMDPVWFLSCARSKLTLTVNVIWIVALSVNLCLKQWRYFKGSVCTSQVLRCDRRGSGKCYHQPARRSGCAAQYVQCWVHPHRTQLGERPARSKGNMALYNLGWDSVVFQCFETIIHCDKLICIKFRVAEKEKQTKPNQNYAFIQNSDRHTQQ